MASRGILRKFVRGEVIFRQGEPGHVMYFVLAGKVHITHGVRGQEKVLTVLGKGSFFGELALFTKRNRSATATVREDCEVIEVDAEQLEQFLTEHPEVARQMVHVLARRLRETDDMLENVRLEDAESRVTNTLLHFAEEAGGFSRCDIPYDLALLSQKTSLAPETVRRILLKLEKHHLIEYVDNRLHVPSVEMLRGYHAYLASRLGHPTEPQAK